MRGFAVYMSALVLTFTSALPPAMAEGNDAPEAEAIPAAISTSASMENAGESESAPAAPSEGIAAEESLFSDSEASGAPSEPSDERTWESVQAAQASSEATPSPSPSSSSVPQQVVTVYRLYNPASGEHFYTHDAAEKNHLVAAGWYDEGTAWQAPASSEVPVYRLYYAPMGEHHYTTDAHERSVLLARGWKAEGVLCYASGADGVPVYRQYNPRGGAGAHNFTTSKAENDSLVAGGWRGEGVAFYMAGEGEPQAQSDSASATITTENVYRLYHAGTGEHFYTRNATEKNQLVNAGWYDEGIAWGAPS